MSEDDVRYNPEAGELIDSHFRDTGFGSPSRPCRPPSEPLPRPPASAIGFRMRCEKAA